MSSWVMTVLIAFGKALLISLSILVGSCCLRLLYRLWIRRMGCHDRSEDVSESCKYEMELQSAQEMNLANSTHSLAHDAVSEIDLPPSPGANTSCPPYSTYSRRRYHDRMLNDDYSDNFSGVWQQNPTSEGGETTDAELTSVAGETITVCSVLTGNEDQVEMESTPFREMPSPCMSEMKPIPIPDFQDYPTYAEVTRYPMPSRQNYDRGTELFLSQYYKSLEQEREDSRSPPPI